MTLRDDAPDPEFESYYADLAGRYHRLTVDLHALMRGDKSFMSIEECGPDRRTPPEEVWGLLYSQRLPNGAKGEAVMGLYRYIWSNLVGLTFGFKRTHDDCGDWDETAESELAFLFWRHEFPRLVQNLGQYTVVDLSGQGVVRAMQRLLSRMGVDGTSRAEIDDLVWELYREPHGNTVYVGLVECTERLLALATR